MTADSVLVQRMAGVPCLIVSSWLWASRTVVVDRDGTISSDRGSAVSEMIRWRFGVVAAKWSGR